MRPGREKTSCAAGSARSMARRRKRISRSTIALFPPEFEKPYREAIRSACAEFAPFRVSLSDVRHFDEKVIYWAPTEASAIDALRTRIVSLARAMSRVKGAHARETKVPHQTIAAGLEP